MIEYDIKIILAYNEMQSAQWQQSFSPEIAANFPKLAALGQNQIQHIQQTFQNQHNQNNGIYVNGVNIHSYETNCVNSFDEINNYSL